MDQEELWKVFQNLVCNLNSDQIFCIIDALDECDSTRTELLEGLKKLEARTDSSFKVIITSSQLSHDIPMILKAAYAINLDVEAGVQADLDKVVRSEVSHLIKKAPKYAGFVNDIDKLLCYEKTFLAAEVLSSRLLTVRALSTLTSIWQELCQSPKQYFSSNIVKCVLNELSPEFQNIARNALTWIACSQRSLTINELAIAVTIMNDSEPWPSIEDRIPRDMASDLEHLFGPLVKIDHSGVRFTHSSIRQVLLGEMKRPKSEQTWYSLGCADDWHGQIAGACLRYLCAQEFSEAFINYSGDGIEPELRLPDSLSYALLAYVA